MTPLSSSWIIRQWFTDPESSSAPHPTPRPHTHSGWGLLWLHRPQSKVFWSGSYRFYLPSIFIGPNYGAVLAIITFYHQFRKGSGGRSVVLAPFPPPSSSLTPPTLSQSLDHKVPWLQSPCNLIRAYSRGCTVSKHARWQRYREKLSFDLLKAKKKKQRWHILSSRPGLKRGFQINVLTH